MKNKELTISDIIEIWTKYECEYKEQANLVCMCKLSKLWCNIHTCPLVFNFETNKFERQNLDAESDCYKSIVFMELLFNEKGEYNLSAHKCINLPTKHQIRLKQIGFFDINEPIKMRFRDRGGDVLIKDVVVLDKLSRKCYVDTLLSDGYEDYEDVNMFIDECLHNKYFRFLVFEKKYVS